MAVDLDEINADWLAENVPKTRNSRHLIEHLRRNARITPALSQLLADLLEGKKHASPKRSAPLKVRQIAMVESLEHYRAILKVECGEELYDAAVAVLRAEGQHPDPQTKGEVTKAALFLTARAFGLRAAQLDEALHPRVARQKTR